ncbi:MAG: hypothetical protein MUF74_08525 [Cypionkella sp.]|jgi:hypothetical protein|nr:hypothetical protein [Cypionkella sp.]
MTSKTESAPPRPLSRLVATLVAGATALSLLAATAVPARADDSGEQLAKALLAAIAIGAIVHQVDKNKRRAEAPVEVRDPRGLRLPRVCAIEVTGNRRNTTVYGERCLREEGVRARLPRHCAFEARIYGKTERLYPETCLREAGFRAGGRDDRPRWRDDHRRPSDHWERDHRDWRYQY